MIKLDEYLSTLNSHNELSVLYEKINNYKIEHFIPAVRFDTALFLYELSLLRQPRRLLEIGFGSGTSSIFLRKALSTVDTFISLERDNNRFVRGIDVIDHFGVTDIQLVKCDAFKYLDEFVSTQSQKTFDLIFLDAVKRDYKEYLTYIKQLTTTGSILITDNILFNEKVLLSNDELPDKYKDGVSLLKEFNEELANTKCFNTAFYNIGDGMSVSIRL